MLNPVSLGLAGGILGGLCLFVMTWVSIWTQYASKWLSIVCDVYPGFTITPLGSIIGLLWGFVDGFLFLFVLAWLYNRLQR